MKSARWTHLALPVRDVPRSIEWYLTHTPLQLIDHRRAEGIAETAWLGHVDSPDSPFVLVITHFFADHRFASAHEDAGPNLFPFAHLGVEVTSREAVDAAAKQAEAEGCLHWPAADLPPPIGYVCAITDPDGNVVEISHNQGIFSKMHELALAKRESEGASA
jgi:catechol 2,3-dioxygenase-like lactoylglutathione lyase family enzyme